MAQKKRKSQSLLNGALVLSVSTLLVKIISVIYKIPISNMMGAVGRGYFDSAYNLYIPIYTISMAGLPVAVSKRGSRQIPRCAYDFSRVGKAVYVYGYPGHGASSHFCISLCSYSKDK